MSDDTTTAKKRAPRRRKSKPSTGMAEAPRAADPSVAKTLEAVAPISAPEPRKRTAATRKPRRPTTNVPATNDATATPSAVTPRSSPKASAAKASEASGASEAAKPLEPKVAQPRAAASTTSDTEAAAATPTLAAHRILTRTPLAVRWRDLDAFNHVNNSKYLSYLEEARLQWMLTLPGKGLDERVAPVVAAAHLNYRRPIEWPCDVTVELFVERLGNTSVTVGHRILDARNADAPVLFCDGHVVLVWIDRSSGAAAALPGPVRASCS